MAQIKQVGIGRKSSGTIDGITYYTRNGVTYARSAPTMPASAYNTPAAKLRQAIFKMVQMHLKYHLRTIKKTFSVNGNSTHSNRYYSVNGKALTKALTTLAEQYVDGEDVTLDDIEAAISAYATENPKSIKIASLSGYNEVYLTGPWPDTIRMSANGGDSTVIIIVNEHGQTKTYNPDGSTVVVQDSNGSNTEQGSTASDNENQNSGTDTGGDNSGDNGGGGDTSDGSDES